MASKLTFICAGLATAILFCAGCANTYRAPLKPPSGAFFTSYTVPLTTDFQSLPVAGLKKEHSESFYLCWPYPTFDLAWGDERALGKVVRSNRFSKVGYADLEVFTVLGLFGCYTVNLYGPGPSSADTN